MTLRKLLKTTTPKEVMPTYFVDSDWPKSTFSRSEVYMKKKNLTEGYPFGMSAKFWPLPPPKKKFISIAKNNISYSLLQNGMCAYQGVRNVAFSEKVSDVLNECTKNFRIRNLLKKTPFNPLIWLMQRSQ